MPPPHVRGPRGRPQRGRGAIRRGAGGPQRAKVMGGALGPGPGKIKKGLIARGQEGNNSKSNIFDQLIVVACWLCCEDASNESQSLDADKLPAIYDSRWASTYNVRPEVIPDNHDVFIAFFVDHSFCNGKGQVALVN